MKRPIRKLRNVVERWNLCNNAVNLMYIRRSYDVLDVIQLSYTTSVYVVTIGKGLRLDLTLQDHWDFHEFHLTYFSPVFPLYRHRPIYLVWKSTGWSVFNGNTWLIWKLFVFLKICWDMSDVSRAFWADRYIHRTHKGAPMVGVDLVNFPDLCLQMLSGTVCS